jgi:hypothetical protein
MTTLTKILPGALTVSVLAFAPAAHGGEPATQATQDGVKAAIEEALRDELQGEAMYARVLKDHGDVRPFSNVVVAERRHATLLEDLLRSRGLDAPAHPAGAEAPAYASVKEACAAAVAFETKNVALYDRLLAQGPLPDDVKRAFDHNRMASLEHHKPAFERCAGVAGARAARRGAGQGAGRCGHGGTGCGHGGGRGCGHEHGHHGCGHCGHGDDRS